MKIKRAVKSAAVKNELNDALGIAERSGIQGVEIQELFKLMENCPLEKRIDIVLDCLKDCEISSLVYHFPLPDETNTGEAKKSDLVYGNKYSIVDLTEETIKEASLVGKALEIETEIPIVIHLSGFAERKEISLENRNKALEAGEKTARELEKEAAYYSEKEGVRIVLARENNPPEHGNNILGLIDFHPKDVIRTAGDGIGTNLDFAHLWMNILYNKEGRGELPGVDLSNEVNGPFDFKTAIELMSPSLKMLHMNDAGSGFQKETEGREIGRGNVPHEKVIPYICQNIKQDIIGTYELKKGHLDPESVYRSDQYYRNLFKEDFFEYFD